MWVTLPLAPLGEQVYSLLRLFNDLPSHENTGAAGGTAQDQEAVLREMVQMLANRNDLPSSFGNTVKQAFKDALRESSVQVVPENPSRKLTGKAEESGEGRS